MALQHYLKSEDIAVRIGKASDHHAHRAPLTAIATTYSKLGNHREALHHYRQALEVSRKIGDRPDVVATLRRLAVTHEILREFSEDRALRYAQEAVELARAHGLRQERRSAPSWPRRTSTVSSSGISMPPCPVINRAWPCGRRPEKMQDAWPS